MVFTDRSAAVKIRTIKFSIIGYSIYSGLLIGVVSPEHRRKILNHKIFSEGLRGNSAKFGTSENPTILYKWE